MITGALAPVMLANEARGLLTRLARIKPFALHEAMVPAAAISPLAQHNIEQFLVQERRKLRREIEAFIRGMAGARQINVAPNLLQKRYTLLRLKFNTVLTKFDLFADVITQRSEVETGVWLSGLDSVAADALALPEFYQSPPVICYLDRGVGAAIRRARTRLPGGGSNPVAIIRVPRERMIGSGIASSLIHEVGHQASAILDLVNSLRNELRIQSGGANDLNAFWDRWMPEILADFWSVARVGIGSTQGLIGVVSLPRPFVFRVNLDDPHPIPWIRVKISCAIGQALYPDSQWLSLSRLWEQLYPTKGLPEEIRSLLRRLEAGIPALVRLIIQHRPGKLRGRTLMAVVQVEQRQPERLRVLYQTWQKNLAGMYRAPPSLVFAVIGQARSDNRITPEQESDILAKLLTHWALQSSLENSFNCGRLQQVLR